MNKDEIMIILRYSKKEKRSITIDFEDKYSKVITTGIVKQIKRNGKFIISSYIVGYRRDVELAITGIKNIEV